MTSRKKIEKACRENGFVIQELDYCREYMAVPEELVPIGWALRMNISTSEDFEDIVGIYGDVDDILSKIKIYADMKQFRIV